MDLRKIIWEHFHYMDKPTRKFSIGFLVFVGVLIAIPFLFMDIPPYEEIGQDYIYELDEKEIGGSIDDLLFGEVVKSTDTTSIVEYPVKTYRNGYKTIELEFSKCFPDSVWRVVGHYIRDR